MKKSHIILAAVPVVCALGGFGAGKLLQGGETATAAAVVVKDDANAPATAAEGVLHNLAEEEAGLQKPAPKAEDEQHTSVMGQAKLIKASYNTDEVQQMVTPASRLTDQVVTHRLDYGILANHAQKRVLEEQQAEKRAAYEAKMAEMKKTAESRVTNPALLPVDVEADIHAQAIKRIEATEDHVVKLGRITLPVQGAAKTTYYVADFGIAVANLDHASFFYEGENAARVRDSVMTTLHELAPTQLMRSDRVNSDEVAQRLTKKLRAKFAGVEDFIFLSLYKTDIPRT